jgi:hypothetical protein
MESLLSAERVVVAESLNCLTILIVAGFNAVFSAALSVFLDYLMEEHPLGKWYAGTLKNLPAYIAKPLGECIFCAGTWVYFIICFFLIKVPFLICLIGSGVNHLAILYLLTKSRNWTKNL